jgi:putative phage-type endonuclease
VIYHDIQQGTEEWLNLRRGKFTASTFKNLMATKTTQTYNDEIMKVVYERLTGESPENFTNDYMKRGTELEPLAKERYMIDTFTKIEDSGFFEYNDWIGCSPDGLIGNDGLIEIKCPKYSTMINYLLKKELPTEYRHQVHGQLWITGRDWCDFVGYHPKLSTVIVRVNRNEEIIKELVKETDIAIAKAQEMLTKLKGQSNG